MVVDLVIEKAFRQRQGVSEYPHQPRRQDFHCLVKFGEHLAIGRRLLRPDILGVKHRRSRRAGCWAGAGRQRANKELLAQIRWGFLAQGAGQIARRQGVIAPGGHAVGGLAATLLLVGKIEKRS